jgi:hypothetical protein
MQILCKTIIFYYTTLSCMSERYKVNLPKMQHGGKVPAHTGASGAHQMNKVTDTLLDVTKVAVVGGVAIGTIAAAGALLKK